MMMIPFPVTSRRGFTDIFIEALSEINEFIHVHWMNEMVSNSNSFTEADEKELRLIKVIWLFVRKYLAHSSTTRTSTRNWINSWRRWNSTRVLGATSHLLWHRLIMNTLFHHTNQNLSPFRIQDKPSLPVRSRSITAVFTKFSHLWSPSAYLIARNWRHPLRGISRHSEG